MISLSRSESRDARHQQAFYEYQPATVAAFMKTIVSSTWSPIVWEDGRRLKSKFRGAGYVALDFDLGTPSLEDILEFVRITDTSHILATTKSHQIAKVTATGKVSAACDRFRLVMPTQTVCEDRELYEYNMKLMVSFFGADASCTDAGRFFYPCKEIVSFSVKGRRITWSPYDPDYVMESERWARRRAKLAAQGKAGVAPAWLADILFGRVIVLEGDRHKTAFRIGCNFAALGWDEELAVAKIMKTSMSDIGEDDIRRCVENGFSSELGSDA